MGELRCHFDQLIWFGRVFGVIDADNIALAKRQGEIHRAGFGLYSALGDLDYADPTGQRGFCQYALGLWIAVFKQ